MKLIVYVRRQTRDFYPTAEEKLIKILKLVNILQNKRLNKSGYLDL